MSQFTKLFSSIVTSSLWSESAETCKVWVTMMAMVDRDGIVEATIPGLAQLSHVTIPQAEEAIRVFMSPDKYSRTKTLSGKRIVRVEGGWRLINYLKYREKANAEEKQSKDAERLRQWRKRHKLTGRETLGKRSGNAGKRRETRETPGNAGKLQGEGEGEAEAEVDPYTKEREREARNSPLSPGPLVDVSIYETLKTCGWGGTARQFADEVRGCLAAGRSLAEIETFIRAHPGQDIYQLRKGLVPPAVKAGKRERTAEEQAASLARIERIANMGKEPRA